MAKRQTLTRALLMESAQRQIHEVVIDGVSVYIREQSNFQGSHRGSMLFNDQGGRSQKGFENARAWLIIDQLVNEDGTPLFEESDLAEIQQLSYSRLQPIHEAIAKINDMDDKKKRTNRTAEGGISA